jgi:hypothetical protein
LRSKLEAQLKEVIEKAATKKEVTVRGTKGTGRKNEWWAGECEQLKKEAVKTLREWKSNKIDRNRFLEAKRRYRERCREKKKQKGEKEKKEIKEIRTGREVCNNKNRERKKKEPVSEQEWEEYFMKLLERRKEEGEAAEEVERQIRKLNMRKAPGRDGVQKEW